MKGANANRRASHKDIVFAEAQHRVRGLLLSLFFVQRGGNHSRCPLGSLGYVMILCAVMATGCAKRPEASYESVPDGIVARDSARAQAMNDEGLALMRDGNVDEATEKFREALAADIYFSPAHNNLGLALMKSNKFYEAAWEFQYAAKLSPHATEPRNNLGLLYEELGRLDKAAEQYETSLDVDPNNLAAMRYLARTYVKADREDEELIDLLERLFGIPSDSPQWDYWVRGQLVRLGRKEAAASDSEWNP